MKKLKKNYQKKRRPSRTLAPPNVSVPYRNFLFRELAIEK